MSKIISIEPLNDKDILNKLTAKIGVMVEKNNLAYDKTQHPDDYIELIHPITNKDKDIYISNKNKLVYGANIESGNYGLYDNLPIIIYVVSFQILSMGKIRHCVLIHVIFTNVQFSYLFYDYNLKKNNPNFKLIVNDENKYDIDMITGLKKTENIFYILDNKKNIRFLFYDDKLLATRDEDKHIDIRINNGFTVNRINDYLMGQYIDINNNLPIRIINAYRNNKYFDKFKFIKGNGIEILRNIYYRDIYFNKVINNTKYFAVTSIFEVDYANPIFSSNIELVCLKPFNDDELPKISININETHVYEIEFFHNKEMNFIMDGYHNIYPEKFVLCNTNIYTLSEKTYIGVLIHMIDNLPKLNTVTNSELINLINTHKASLSYNIFEKYSLDFMNNLYALDQFKENFKLNDDQFNLKEFLKLNIFNNDLFKYEIKNYLSYYHTDDRTYMVYEKKDNIISEKILELSNENVLDIIYNEKNKSNLNIDDIIRNYKGIYTEFKESELFFKHNKEAYSPIIEENKKNIYKSSTINNINNYLAVFIDEKYKNNINNPLISIRLENKLLKPIFLIYIVNKKDTKYYITLHYENNSWIVYDYRIKSKLLLHEYNLENANPYLIIYNKFELFDKQTEIYFKPINKSDFNKEDIFYYENNNYEYKYAIENLLFDPKNYTEEKILEGLQNKKIKLYPADNEIDPSAYIGSIKGKPNMNTIINYHSTNYIENYINNIKIENLNIQKYEVNN